MVRIGGKGGQPPVSQGHENETSARSTRVRLGGQSVRVFLPTKEFSAQRLNMLGLVELKGLGGQQFFVRAADAKKLERVVVGNFDVRNLVGSAKETKGET
ncbi:MAG: hypothetical protein COV45_00855 [Deltaproteobacteria bacterium CG11_big_fil_rev_8_21_14_0_20_47_16]|nr:MAG: hypothetical protein COV45_00855 [Deltaproteobacteria bacterium CG11_big_fil_rev_8_21_14_0_20_47_16]